MLHPRLRTFFFAACGTALLFTAGCAPIARVQRVQPSYKPIAAVDQDAGNRLAAAAKIKDPAAAIGAYLAIAKSELEKLKRNPSDAKAIKVYNFAVSEAFRVMYQSKLNPWSQPLRTPEFLISRKGTDTRMLRDPANYDFVPCNHIKIGGTFFETKAERDGLGAPVIAAWKGTLDDPRKYFLGSKHIYYGMTAIARFEGDRCVLELCDPLAADTVNVAGRTYPLAGNFSDGIAIHLIKERPQRLGLARMLNPGKFEDTTRLFRMQPFDPKKTPVLLVHGLQDTPATWAPMFNGLLADPAIRKHYQFWFFSYASGDPFPYSATILRRELDAIAKVYPHRPIIMVGHSMGGLVTRLMVSDSGDVIWRDIFKSAPKDTKLNKDTLALMEQSLIFSRRKEVSRVIFIATPHRGSNIASNWIGRLGSKLVKLPAKLVEAGTEIVEAPVLVATGEKRVMSLPTSIDTLSPTNRFLLAMNKIPISPKVPYHQIVGDRGRGDTPNSSDGVVAYWSSHLEGAQSEKIVPSGHMANRNPQAIDEVKRILKEHLRD